MMENVTHLADDLEAYENSLLLLKEVGYTRANSKTVQPFDKIAGGMVWCIERCSFDIDVDLYFKENLNIGQKIALTEALVQAFHLMKCPHSLEPHQIQGLDYLRIYPVIKWLVELTLSLSKDGRPEGQRPRVTLKTLFPGLISDDEDEGSENSENLEEQVSQMEELLAAMREEKNKLEEEQAAMAEEYALVRQERKANFESDGHLDFQTEDEESQYATLLGLVEELDRSKEVDKSFKESAKREKEAIEKEIRELTSKGGSEVSDSVKGKLESLQREKKLLENELGSLESHLASVNLNCLQIERRLDEIPSSAELNLYQRTFLQLEDQVCAQERELTSLYTLLNSLTDEKSFLGKEVTVVDSILESITRLQKQPNGWYEVGKQLKTVLDGLLSTKREVLQKLVESKKHKNILLTELEALRDTERQYERALKELQELLERSN